MTYGDSLFAMYYAQQNNGYIKKGLVAWWDGIDNAGIGVHDDNATIWKDLAGSLDLEYNLANGVIRQDHLETNGLSAQSFVSISYENVLTIECVVQCEYNNSRQVIFCCGEGGGGPSNLMSRSLASEGNYFLLSHGQGTAFSSSKMQMAITWSKAAYPASMYPKKLFQDGNNVEIATNLNGISIKRSLVTFGSTSAGDSGSHSKIYAVRVYNRELSSSEIAHNYKVDKTRFNLS